jgi:outer membrane protein, heavy metal efflux system
VLRSQVETENARIELARSQFQLEAAWQVLSARMGTPHMPQPMLIGDIEAPAAERTWEESLRRLQSESPEMAVAVLRVERARWALSRAKAEPIPNVTVQGSLQHDNASHFDIAGVQATFPVPLFNRNQGNIMAAQSDLRAAEHDLDRVALALQQRLADVYAQYGLAQRQANVYRTSILDKSKKTLDLVTQGYKLGEFNYTDLLTAQRTYFEASLTYLNALKDLRAAEARLEGLLLGGSLEDPEP